MARGDTIFDLSLARTYYEAFHRVFSHYLDHPLKELLIPFLKEQTRPRILEIGCGNGDRILLLRSLGFSITGVDISSEMVELAGSRVGKAFVTQCDAKELEFQDNEFDISLLLNTLEFVCDPVAVLREAARVSRRKVIVACFNSFSTMGLKAMLWRLIGHGAFSTMRTYTHLQLSALIKKAMGRVLKTYISPYNEMFPPIFFFLISLKLEALALMEPLKEGLRSDTRLANGLVGSIKRGDINDERGISL